MPEIKQQPDTRRIFIDTLCELAEKDDSIVLIVPDVGFNYIDKFREKFPKRYFNLGTTEASTVVIASAMALSGLKPYVYSMINFVLFRPYEMVRNMIVNHHANVKLLGVKGSSGYKFLGFSHNLSHDKEDIHTCDNLGLEWHLPSCNEDVRNIILETYNSEKACYVRL